MTLFFESFHVTTYYRALFWCVSQQNLSVFLFEQIISRCDFYKSHSPLNLHRTVDSSLMNLGKYKCVSLT